MSMMTGSLDSTRCVNVRGLVPSVNVNRWLVVHSFKLVVGWFSEGLNLESSYTS